MKIKKVSGTAILNGNVVDSLEGNSTTNAPSQRAVQEIFTYSTTEQKVGIWLDDKPVYRKVVANELSMENGTTIDVSTLNIDKIISIKTIEQNTSTSKIFDGVLYDNQNLKFSIHYQPNNNKLEAWTVADSIFLVTIILEYTKTSD